MVKKQRSHDDIIIELKLIIACRIRLIGQQCLTFISVLTLVFALQIVKRPIPLSICCSCTKSCSSYTERVKVIGIAEFGAILL